jgi:hypothetical protein
MKLPKIGDYWIRIDPLDNKKLYYVVKILNIFTDINYDLRISYQYVSDGMYNDRLKDQFLQDFEKISQSEYKILLNEEMIKNIIE